MPQKPNLGCGKYIGSGYLIGDCVQLPGADLVRDPIYRESCSPVISFFMLSGFCISAFSFEAGEWRSQGHYWPCPGWQKHYADEKPNRVLSVERKGKSSKS